MPNKLKVGDIVEHLTHDDGKCEKIGSIGVITHVNSDMQVIVHWMIKVKQFPGETQKYGDRLQQISLKVLAHGAINAD